LSDSRQTLAPDMGEQLPWKHPHPEGRKQWQLAVVVQVSAIAFDEMARAFNWRHRMQPEISSSRFAL
jgi:hypothetical protein